MRIWKSFRISHIIALTFVYLLILLAPQKVQARWSLVPRFYVEEQYDDNLFLTESDEQDDFATVVSPGLNLTYETPTTLVDLDYEFRHFFYYEFTELDFNDHRGRLEARKDFTPWFSAGVSERLIRSEDPIELTGAQEFERPSIRAGERNRYTRNIVEPEAIFRFGERNSIRLGYRNQILRNNADDVADQDENAGNALLTYRVNTNNGLEFYYEHLDQDYGSTTQPRPPRDFKAHIPRGRYTYYFDPITSVFFEFRFIKKEVDNESPVFPSYEVYDPGLGFSHSPHENISITASGGYALRKADDIDDEEAFSGRLDFTGRYKRLNATAYGAAGFGDDFTSADALGSNKFWRVGLNSRYQFLERFQFDVFLFLEEDKFLDIDRTDKYYNARGRLNYQPLRWLLFSLDYTYNERDSDAPFRSYTRNRVFFRITFQHDIAEQFQ